MMDFIISVLIDFDNYDRAVTDFCVNEDVEYIDLIELIEDDLLDLPGVSEVMFNHSSWMVVELGTADFDEAKEEFIQVQKEIQAVFAKHGIVL